jgi:hypothetical protein
VLEAVVVGVLCNIKGQSHCSQRTGGFSYVRKTVIVAYSERISAGILSLSPESH